MEKILTVIKKKENKNLIYIPDFVQEWPCQ